MTLFGMHLRPDTVGGRLQGTFAVHAAYEDMHQIRVVLTHVLALGGILLWIVGARPGIVSNSSRTVLLATWGLLGIVTLLVSAREWVWSRRRELMSNGFSPPMRR